MNIIGLFRVAWQALIRNSLRSLLTMLGIIIGVGAVITSMAIGNGARAAVEAQLANLGSNLIVVRPGSSESGGVQLGAGNEQTLVTGDATAIQTEVPEVVAVSPESGVNVQAVAGSNNWATQAVGATVSWPIVNTWNIAQGRYFSASEDRTGASVAVLGQTVATNLFPAGDAINQHVTLNNEAFTVVGVLVPKGPGGWGQDQDDQIVVPLKAMGLRLNGNSWLSRISVEAASPDAVNTVVSATQTLLRLRHKLTPTQADDFTVRNLSSIQAAFNATSQIQALLLASIAAVSLVVGGIGIMNIMLVSVTERTREIGVRMSVGARGRDIMSQFLVEAVTLSCIGGILGILLGIGASELTSKAAGWSVIVAPQSLVLSVGFSAAIGILFGFYPARRASLLNPIDALHHE